MNEESDDYSSNSDGYGREDLSGNFPLNFLLNTGHSLSELIKNGRIVGEAVDYGPDSTMSCTCNQPHIRYVNTLKYENEEYPIGSTCVEMFVKAGGRIKCASCEKEMTEIKVRHSADGHYRCDECRQRWLQDRCEKRAREKQQKKEAERQRLRIEELEREREAFNNRVRERERESEARLERMRLSRRLIPLDNGTINTYPFKEIIKSLGGEWKASEKKWYIPQEQEQTLLKIIRKK